MTTDDLKLATARTVLAYFQRQQMARIAHHAADHATDGLDELVALSADLVRLLEAKLRAAKAVDNSRTQGFT